ncbi:MAG: PAS domain-containing protein, partial [Verrucomicrobiota bacterium]
MKMINRKKQALTKAGPASQAGEPVKSAKDSPDAASQSAQLAQENKRLAQENERLARERDLLRIIIDDLPDFIYAKDSQSRFLINNLAHTRVLGATHPDEVAGKTDLDIFPAEVAKQYYADEQALIKSSQPLNREETVVDPKTGETRWLQTTKMPLHDKDGKVIGLVGISRYITEKKRTEESLVRAYRQLRAVLDNIPDRIYFKDTESRFVQCNQAVARRVGAEDVTQVIGKTDFDFYPRETAEEFRRDEQKVMKAGQPLINKIEQMTRPDGEVTWASVTKVPLRDQDGKVMGLVGITRDITELKLTETALLQSRDDLEKRVTERAAKLSQERRLLRTLIDNLPDAIYAKDTAGRKTLVNPADLKNLGCKTEAEAIGKNDFDLFPKDVAEKFWADDQKVIGGEPVINREEHFTDETGQQRWLLTSKLPLRDSNGKIIGLVGIGRNITQTKQVEDRLAYEQELFHMLLDTIPDNIYFKDRGSRLVRASKSKVEAAFQTVRDSYQAAHPAAAPGEWPAHLASVETFGEWLIGKTDFDIYPEAHARAAHEDEQEIIRTGQPIVGKLEKAILDNGRTIWWLSTKMPWRSRDGNIVGTFGVSKDVTAIKETEETLIRERVLLRTLIDNLPDGIYAKDAAGRKTLVNPADLKNIGCKTEADAIGKSDFDFYPKDVAEKFWADDQKVLAGQPVIDREEFFLNEKGKKRWLLTSKLPLRARSGKVVGLIGVGRDITFKKQAEEALARERLLLRTLIDSLPDLVFVKDSQGRFTVTNTACAKQLGVSRPEKVLGKSDADFVAPELAAQYLADEQALMRSGQPVTKE